MTISYPLAFPSDPDARVQMFRMHNATAESRSPFTGSGQVYQHPGQWWRCAIDLPPLTRAQYQVWAAWLASLRGKYGTLHIGPRTALTPLGSASGTPLIDGAGQTGVSLATKGWTPSAPNVLKAGDFLQVGSGTTQRLYMNLQDVSADGGGDATLDIWPRLRESPADSASIVTSNCEGTFRLSENSVEWTVDIEGYYHMSFEVLEAI